MNKRNLAASVRQRLLNKARAESRPFQELLQYYAMERFLYRLARSSHAERFILKGALLLTAWQAPFSRPTMDIDLAGRTSNDLEHIRRVTAEICTSSQEADGIEFDATSIEVSRIKEDADYEGVRIRFRALLAGARVPMQIDIGFGDVIVPNPATVEYPALLDFPHPVLTAYPKETVIAEKLEAATSLGLLNSRLKDYFDLWLLPRIYDFRGTVLVEAIAATFRNRQTAIEPLLVGLSDVFGSDPAKQLQWSAFLRRSRLDGAPVHLPEALSEIRGFVHAPLNAASEGTSFEFYWKPKEHWQKL